MTTRRVDGGPSARALLISLLGQFVVPTGGTAWTAALVAALGELGVEEGAARQAVARTAADGWLVREPHGRRTLCTISPAGRALLEHAWQRLERTLGEPPEWNGTWVLVTLLAPVGDRAVRRRLARRLAFEGFGTLGPDVWLGAHNAGAARRVLAELELDEHAAVAEGRLSLPATDPAARAWDLTAAAAAHHRFLEETEAAFDELVDDRAAFVWANRIAHAWREVLALDPVLPAGLLPPDWPGEAARRRFVDLWWATSERAMTYYTTLTVD